MTFKQFVEKYDGKYVEVYDSTSPNQCVDLALAWLQELGYGYLIPLGVGSAYEIYNLKRLTQFFEMIPNTIDAIPQEGDIVVWSKSYNGGAGHVGIATERAGQLTLDCFVQNDPIDSPCHIKRYSYDHILGWLREKEENMSDLQECLEQHEELVTKLEACKKDKEALEKTIQGKDSAITAAQRERDEARTEAANAKEELSRVREQLLICENQLQSLSVANKKLQEMNDSQGRVIGGLETTIQKLETENRELKKNCLEGVSASELLRLAILKFLRLG